jgi:diguanylate cyclase (GGDEF)-like protein
MKVMSMMKYKLQSIAVFLTIVLVAIPTILLYQHTRTTVIKESGKEARNVAISIATFLERDIIQYKKLNNAINYEFGNYDTKYYIDMLRIFRNIKVETGADYIFTEKLVSEEQVAYILDSEPMNSDTFSPIGSYDTLSEWEWEAFQTGKATSTELIQDPVWGTYITGFAPIRDLQTNEVIGLVGVDYSSSYIYAMLEQFQSVIFIVFIIIVAILSTLVVTVINQQNKRINYDYLTGLYNRKYFEEVLQRMIKTSKAKKLTFSLMIIDVDDFKQINDNFGHSVGDNALRKVAHFIQSNLEEHDLAFRYGGDEFSVILPNKNKEQAMFISKRLNDELSNSMITLGQDLQIKIFVSIGLEEYTYGTSAVALINNADLAMYTVKFSKLKASH